MLQDSEALAEIGSRKIFQEARSNAPERANRVICGQRSPVTQRDFHAIRGVPNCCHRRIQQQLFRAEERLRLALDQDFEPTRIDRHQVFLREAGEGRVVVLRKGKIAHKTSGQGPVKPKQESAREYGMQTWLG